MQSQALAAASVVHAQGFWARFRTSAETLTPQLFVHGDTAVVVSQVDLSTGGAGQIGVPPVPPS